MKLFVINSKDGTPRWIWPKSSTNPYFLKFYPTTTFKQKLFRAGVNLIFKLGFQSLVFDLTSSQKVFFNHFPTHQKWALFCGTAGPNNKHILYEATGSNSFTKYAHSAKGKQLITQEINALTFLKKHKLRLSFTTPEVLDSKVGILKINDLNAVKSTQDWTEKHNRAVRDMALLDYQKKSLEKCSFWKKSIAKKEALESKNSKFKDLIAGVNLLINQLDLDQKTQTHFGHGDLTPWNSFYNHNNDLAIIDWELASNSLPLGFDLFHYITQTEIMLGNRNAKSIFSKINHAATESLLFESKEEQDYYFKLYLIYNITYYCDLYSLQKNWHEQIFWQIQTWHDLLSYLTHQNEQRQLFIQGFFAKIGSFNYAGLKIPNGALTNLSEFSDLDLIIHKADYPSFIQLINQSKWIESVTAQMSYTLSNVKIIFKDGSRLDIDFIFSLRRKSLIYLNAKNLIQNAVQRQDGIKESTPLHTAQFIGLFYLLNKSKIPRKYLIFKDELLPRKNQLNHLLHTFFVSGNTDKQAVLKFLKKQKENSNLKGIVNKIYYTADKLKSIIQNRGFIITFSGVDGAGKSTVIEKAKHTIEKKYRKPVKVLRHRPSILPILSSIKYGKTEAEARTLKKLPRTGGNKSKTLSILRFGYYYMDYLIGQFIVYIKYILRGHIVLYDRYYFDMINDARRSNINVSKHLSLLGYKALLKPRYNFFLFASEEVILSRKKELDGPTIQALTTKYKDLFARYNSKYMDSNYQCLENINIDKTLNRIFKTVNFK